MLFNLNDCVAKDSVCTWEGIGSTELFVLPSTKLLYLGGIAFWKVDFWISRTKISCNYRFLLLLERLPAVHAYQGKSEAVGDWTNYLQSWLPLSLLHLSSFLLFLCFYVFSVWFFSLLFFPFSQSVKWSFQPSITEKLFFRLTQTLLFYWLACNS